MTRGTLASQLPTGEVQIAQIQLRAYTDVAMTSIRLVDDGDQGQSVVTARGHVVPLAATEWRLTLRSVQHTVYLLVTIRAASSR